MINWDDPGYYTLWPKMPTELAPPVTGPDRDYTHLGYLENSGTAVLKDVRAAVEGPDADQFTVLMTQVNNIAVGGKSAFAVRFHPTRIGGLSAALKIYSNSPNSPFVLPLSGVGNFDITATLAGGAASNFTYGPLKLDRQTGLLVQQIRFTNTLGVGMYGLRLFLSKLAAGVHVYSSSAGDVPGTVEVHYANPIAAGETAVFDLIYYDAKRRSAASILPTIRAEAILEPPADSPPVTGTIVRLNRVTITAHGPMLDWNSKAGATYVVEYSDNGGAAWQSAIHLLRAGANRAFWVDRGPPETKSKPILNTGGLTTRRQYRIKLLPPQTAARARR